jgi:hypothetical protein
VAVSLTNIDATFTGTGVSSSYPTLIYANASSQIVVKVDGVTKTIGDDYTLNGLGADAGVTVVGIFTAGAVVYVERVTPITQEVDTRNNETILEDVLDGEFDKLTMILQEVAASAVRAVLFPKGEPGQTLPVAADRAGKLISFGPTGDMVLVDSFPDTTALLAVTPFTASAAQTAFVLPSVPEVVLLVIVNGAALTSVSDYTVAGATVTLLTARAVNDQVLIVTGARMALPVVNALDVTFAPDSAPAVRTGQAKMREIISVDDYYKTGDVDDTAAFLRLRDRFLATGGFQALAPKSSYIISSQLDFSGCNNSEIIGRGATNYGRYATAIHANAAMAAMLKIDDPAGPTSGFKLKGLGFDGGGFANKGLDTRALWAWDFQHIGIYNCLVDGWYIDVGSSGFNSQQGYVRKMVIDMGFDAASVNCNGFHVGPGSDTNDTCQSEMYDVQIQCRNGTGYIGGAADTLEHYRWKIYRMTGATGKLINIPGGTNGATFANWYQDNMFVGLEAKVLDGSTTDIFCVGGPAAPARLPQLNTFGMLDQSAPNYPQFYNGAEYQNSIRDEKGYVLQRAGRREDRDGRVTFGGNLDIAGVPAAFAALPGFAGVATFMNQAATANKRRMLWNYATDGKLTLNAFDDSNLFVRSLLALTHDGSAELPWLPSKTSYANDAAAAGGGVPVGGLYRNGSVIQVRVV